MPRLSLFCSFRRATTVLLATGACGPAGTVAQDGGLVSREAWAMGTRVRVVAEGARAAAAAEAALREIERLEKVLSTWDPATELARLNASPAGSAQRITHELSGLLAEAERLAERTSRAFDPTLGPLIDAWGVRGEARTPGEREVAAALRAMGPGALVLRNGRASRGSGDSWIDSGAFGKGAALRCVRRVARAHGVERMLVDLGGQLWAEAPAEAPWPVVVAHPLDRWGPAAQLALSGASVATSGPSERPGHLLDPRTGRPVPAWGSVTVVATDPLEADALSTALYVMGPDEGLSWARANGTAALFLEATDGGLRSRWTEPMSAWLVVQP